MALFPISNTEIIKRSSALLRPFLGREVKTVSDIAIPVVVLNQNPFGESVSITEVFAAGAVPAAKVIYTVPAGKKLYISHIWVTNDSAGAVAITWTDGVGGPSFLIGVKVPVADSPLVFPYPNAAIVRRSINMIAAQQPANSTYYWTIIGWLEDD